MKVRFLEIAQVELDDAIRYYNAEFPDLGDAFLVETLSAIDRVQRFPDAWHPLGEDTRRCRLRRFPYGVIYCMDGETLLVVAVANLHRRPDYWKDRLKQV